LFFPGFFGSQSVSQNGCRPARTLFTGHAAGAAP
jgi:hypothetical protein